jgi:Domain of unknown function (DUF1963)
MLDQFFAAKMASYKRKARRLHLTEGDPGPIPVTKLSGVPWWPRGTERPRCEYSHDMAFIAQINLQDVPEFEKGDARLLSFHYCQECAYAGRMAWGYIVPSHTGYDLSLFASPHETAADGLGVLTPSPLDPCGIQLSDAFEVPSQEEISPELMPPDYPQLEHDFDENVYPGVIHVARSKLGGWPTWMHYPEWPTCKDGSKMVFVAQLAGGECDQATWVNGYAYLFVPPIGAEAEGAQLLIQVT